MEHKHSVLGTFSTVYYSCIFILTRCVDFINLMTYDLHLFNWYYPLAGHNSPLFNRRKEVGYLATLNMVSHGASITSCSHFWCFPFPLSYISPDFDAAGSLLSPFHAILWYLECFHSCSGGNVAPIVPSSANSYGLLHFATIGHFLLKLCQSYATRGFWAVPNSRWLL